MIDTGPVCWWVKDAVHLGRQGRRVLGEWSRQHKLEQGVAWCRDQSINSKRREDPTFNTSLQCVVVNLNLSPTPVTALRFLGNVCRNALVGPHICLWSDERRCYAAG